MLSERLTLFLVSLMLLILSASVLADGTNQTLILDDEFSKQDVTSHAMRVYAGKGLSLSSVQQHMEQWLPATSLAAIPEDAKIWAKVTVRHTGFSNIDLALVVASRHADNVDAYAVDKRRTIKSVYKNQRSNALGHYISFTLTPNEQADIYVAVDDVGATFLPLVLWEESQLRQADQQAALIKTLFFGALCSLILYFFFTYFVQRNVCRFWYTTSVLFFLLFIMHYEKTTLPVFQLLENTNNVASTLLAIALLTGSKVTHYLIFRIPQRLRWLNFSIAGLALVLPLVFSTYLGLVLLAMLVVAWLLAQMVFSLVYPDRRHILPAAMYAGAWLICLCIVLFKVIGFALELPSDAWVIGTTMFTFTCAVVVIGIAIETSERNIRINEFSNQEKRISNLRQFYELFSNSAEGLYTSTIDGKLLSANTALCHLFGYNDETSMLKQVQTTAAFYAKPEDRLALLNDLQAHGSLLGREIHGKRRDGSEFWFSISCQIQTEGKSEYLYGSIIDITERKQSSLSLEYMATHDALTGVLNRREFERLLSTELAQYDDHKAISVLFIDLDRFKQVNDSCGHKAGDELIQNIAHLLHETVGQAGEVARLGGDEFAVLLTNVDEDQAYICANKILHAVQDYRFLYENRIFTIGASIGFLKVPQAGLTAEQVISMADAACYIAKESGRNQIHCYAADEDSEKRHEDELGWLNTINQALQDNNFALYFQQYQALSAGQDGLNIEVLLRLIDDQGNSIPANQFLPAAERYNLSHEIDRWVVENTLQWLSKHKTLLDRLTRCNINLSGLSLTDTNQKLVFLNAFEKYGIPYHKICFEISEMTASLRREETIEFINTFRQLGCKFALDDFGKGVSSYHFLRSLPVDCIKIDGSFVQEMRKDPANQAIVDAIHKIASALNIQTIAEFVEDEATLTEIGKVGVDFAQGYIVSEPQPLDTLLDMN